MSERTCGNCAKGDVWIRCVDDPKFLNGADGSCKRWLPRHNEPEQRYKKLEQVAREMFRYISEKTMVLAPVHLFSDKLAECGVIVDD